MVNPYSLYGRSGIWPQGFPLHSAIQSDTYEFFNVMKPITPIKPLIQQSLNNLKPSVYSMYQLRHTNISFQNYPDGIAIRNGYFSPFTAQNTLFASEAFWGLLFPCISSINFCEVWRGYWVQRLLWDIDGSIVYKPSNLDLNNKTHLHDVENYKNDLADELEMDLKTEKLIEFLSKWESSNQEFFDRMVDLSKSLKI